MFPQKYKPVFFQAFQWKKMVSLREKKISSNWKMEMSFCPKLNLFGGRGYRRYLTALQCTKLLYEFFLQKWPFRLLNKSNQNNERNRITKAENYELNVFHGFYLKNSRSMWCVWRKMCSDTQKMIMQMKCLSFYIGFYLD